MKRIVRLVQATDREIGRSRYQEGLQAMWEARWALRGQRGLARWKGSHGEAPAILCPLLSLAGMRAQLGLRANGPALVGPSRPRRGLRRSIHLRKGSF